MDENAKKFLEDGGIVDGGGLAIVHAGEPILPLDAFIKSLGYHDVFVSSPNDIRINIRFKNIDPNRIHELCNKTDTIMCGREFIDRYGIPKNYRPS